MQFLAELLNLLGMLRKPLLAPREADRAQQGEQGGRGCRHDVSGERVVEEVWSGIERGLEEGLRWQEHHDELAVLGHEALILAALEPIDMPDDVGRVLLHERIRRGLIGAALGLEEGVERDLRIDNDAPVGSQVDDHVGTNLAGLALMGHLLGEVDAVEHAGRLDKSPQLHLAPAAPRPRSAEHRAQPRGLATDIVGRPGEGGDMVGQLGGEFSAQRGLS